MRSGRREGQKTEWKVKKMIQVKIRAEQPDDYRAILRLTYEAFLTLHYPGRRRVDEHFLIHLLQGSEFVTPELSFVAEYEGDIVGHIIYTKSKILCADGTERETVTFGPLSVLPQYHRQGIGAALVAHSMREARLMRIGAVVIEGVPAYYPKLGFRRAREFGLMQKDGTAPDYLMAYELQQGYLAGGTIVFLAPEYVLCEEDDAGYDQFQESFLKEYYPEKAPASLT